MSIQHLSINEYDLAAITNEVNNWKSHGKYASYDISRRDQGLATMVLENVYTEDGSFFVFEIHKLGKKRMIGTKNAWIIQLYSGPDPQGPFEKHGCAYGKLLVVAISEALHDVRHNFLSLVNFEMAVDALL